MRKIFLSAIALATVASAPAAAQWQGERYGNYGGYGQYERYGYQQGQVSAQINQLSRQIDRLYRRGNLTANEARTLSRELSYVARLDQRARYGGYNSFEARELQLRLDRVAQRIRYEARDGDYRNNRGYGDRDYGNRYERGRYGYDWRR